MSKRVVPRTVLPGAITRKRLRPGSRDPVRRVTTWSLLPLGMLGGFLGARALQPPRGLVLKPAFDAAIETLHMPVGRVAYYAGGVAEGAPLLLIHSVNASANSYETKPLFDHYGATRPVYALELPGFGFSDRPDRIYTPRLMSDAIIAVVEEIRRRHGHFPIDVIALSLSCEFLAQAATEHPTFFRTLGLISPTGFETKREREGAGGATFGRPSARDIVSFPLWGRALFEVLVSRPSMRFFLEKTWGSKRIDEGLLDYSYVSAHQNGAEHAPFSFLTGYLFSRDALTCYKELTVPVWMGHGIRGGFVNFSRKVDVVGKPNWTIDVFPTGAFPHFECLTAVAASYGAFLEAVS